MPATLATFAAILKEFYISPILDQLQTEILALDLMEKATVDWNGRVAIMPVHVARNTGVGFRGELGAANIGGAAPLSGANLPAAGQQGYERLQIQAAFQYGRFQVSGPAIAAAKSGGIGSFISYTDAEMKKLSGDVRNQANSNCINGGRVRGYLNERCAPTALGTGGGTGGAQTNAPAFTVTANFQYDGDFTAWLGTGPVGALPPVANWIPVDLIRTDTYNPPTRSGPIANPNWFVTGFDSIGRTIDITFGADLGDSWRTDDVAAGFGIAVALRPVQAIDSAGNPFGMNLSVMDAAVAPVNLQASLMALGEVSGIYTNMSSAAHFGVSRNVQDTVAVPPVPVDGLAPPLRANVQVENVGPTPFAGPDRDQPRAALTLGRMQVLLDSVMLDATGAPGGGGGTLPGGGGETPDVILVNPRVRQTYIGLLNANIQMQAVGRKGMGDGSFLDIAYAGVPIRTSRACHLGHMIFLRKDSWCVAELQAPGFEDLDGAILSRVTNSDAFEGFYRWYWNVVSKHPNNNCALIGFN